MSCRKYWKVQNFFSSDRKRNEPVKMTINVITIFYRKRIIDGSRFIASSLSDFADNLAEGIHKIICIDCDCFLSIKVPMKI